MVVALFPVSSASVNAHILRSVLSALSPEAIAGSASMNSAARCYAVMHQALACHTYMTHLEVHFLVCRQLDIGCPHVANSPAHSWRIINIPVPQCAAAANQLHALAVVDLRKFAKTIKAVTLA